MNLFQSSLQQIISYKQIILSKRSMLGIHNIKTEESLHRPQIILAPSTADLHKVVKSLEKLLSEQKQRREKAQQDLQQYRQRTLKRQGDLCTIIAKLKEYNSTVIKQNPQINKLFSTIWGNFDMFNSKSIQILQEKYQDLIEHMSKKVNQILVLMKRELDKNSLKTSLNLENIQQDIKEVYAVALKIQDRNIALAEEIKTLSFQLKILKQQKALILEDSINRKNKLSSLTSQNKKLNQELLKMKLEFYQKPLVQKNPQTEDIKLFYNRKRSQSKTGEQKGLEDNKKDEKQLSKHRSQLYSFQTLKTNHDNRMETLQFMKDNRDNSMSAKDKQKFLNTTISFTPKSNCNTSLLARREKEKSYAGNTTRKSYQGKARASFQLDQLTNTIPILQGISAITPNLSKQAQTDSAALPSAVSIEHYQKTIKHLQKCLNRQKVRNQKLTQTVDQLLGKSRQINETLQKIFKQEEASNNINRLQTIVKSEKLIQVLRILKQRLGALQKLDINCGWGDVVGEI